MIATRQAVIVQAEDSSEIRELVQALQEQRIASGYLVLEDGRKVALPAPLRHALEHVTMYLARGGQVSISPLDRAYTVAEGAYFLGVTFKGLERLLDEGAIPSQTDGTQRLIALPDLIAYRAVLRQQRAEGVRAIQQLSEEEGAYGG